MENTPQIPEGWIEVNGVAMPAPKKIAKRNFIPTITYGHEPQTPPLKEALNGIAGQIQNIGRAGLSHLSPKIPEVGDDLSLT